MITKPYRLDIIPGGSPLVIRLNQYDEDYILILELFAREGAFTLQSGTRAMIRGTKPNNEAYEASVTLSGNFATVRGDANMTDAAGTGVFELCLKYNEKELYTSNFEIEFEPSPMERGNGN